MADPALHVMVLLAKPPTDERPPVSDISSALCERTPLQWILETVRSLAPRSITVVGPAGVTVPGLTAGTLLPFAAGDGPAALRQLAGRWGAENGVTLVVEASTPLLQTETLRTLLDHYRQVGTRCACLPPAHKASAATGMVWLADSRWLGERLGAAAAEFTDDWALFLQKIRDEALTCHRLAAPGTHELLRLQCTADLVLAYGILRERLVVRWLDAGVVIWDPASVYIGPEVALAAGVEIHQGVILAGHTRVDAEARILPFSTIENSILQRGVRVEMSVIRNSTVEAGTTVGPFAHIRDGAHIGPANRIGNFVEVKKSSTGENTKAAHLAYLGDATLGRDVNIGAGTITCNYDGAHKHPTIIEDQVFVGSDSILVAPLRIGRGAYVGAGSVITLDVPADSLGVGRGRQRIIEGWAAKRRQKLASLKKKS
ncbi:MAG: hypothetical protein JXQ27_09925 [Acidobacteria bacterium]|nr:hypothetical protein [Acidobacteriota bacterium]